MKRLLMALIYVVAFAGITYAACTLTPKKGGTYSMAFDTISSNTNTSACTAPELVTQGVCWITHTGSATKTLSVQMSPDGTTFYNGPFDGATHSASGDSDTDKLEFANHGGRYVRIKGETNVGASNTVSATCEVW